MTCREFIKIKYPDTYEEIIDAHCPSYYDLADDLDCCEYEPDSVCDTCWDRKVTNEEKLQKIISHNSNKEGKTWGNRINENLNPDMTTYDFTIIDDNMITKLPYIPDKLRSKIVIPQQIKDSGERREFETGAVRDIQEGKGRCDLMPLDVVSRLLEGWNYPDVIVEYIYEFKRTGNKEYLYLCLDKFSNKAFNRDGSLGGNITHMILDVAKHFEAGAVKYGENNWQKGIPVHCYIDSAVRHYLKFLRGDDDEPHDRAFVWNIMCCIWTCVHKPELNDFCEVKTDE